MRFLILLTLVAAASATLEHLEHKCDEGWHMFTMKDSSVCMKLMAEPKKFEDAFKECHKIDAELLSFVHDFNKIEFASKLILDDTTIKGPKDATWFVNGEKLRRSLLENRESLATHDLTVIQPAENPNDIKLFANAEDIPRNFICEKLAMATPQLPKFSRQPEDVQIAFEDLPNPESEKRIEPINIPFVCEAFAKPQPDIEWVFVSENSTTRKLDVERIEPKVIYDRREMNKGFETNKPLFFEVRSNCKTKICNARSVVEISELFVIGAQYLDFSLNRTIACVASNTFGQVLSREAQLVINKMDEFPKEEKTFTVFEGKNLTVPCDIDTTPDAAAAQWLRIEEGRRGIELEPIEQLNKRSRGSIQMSKSTFEMIIDFAQMRDSGRYICRVRLHDGRRGFTLRERVIELRVEPCQEQCETKDNPLDVVEGYPTVLSMNPMSNEYIRTGDDFLLECPCMGKREAKEILSVEWRMEQKIAETLPILPPGSAVLMHNANVSFSGNYACRCVREEKEQKEMSDWSNLQVNVLPLIRPNLTKVVEVEAGSSARISLTMPEINIDGLNVAVTPMRGDDSLNDILNEKKDERYQLTKEGNKFNILIKDVKESDMEAYGSRVHVDYFGKWTEVDYYYASLIIQK